MTHQLIAVCDPTLDADSKKPTMKRYFCNFLRKFEFELGIKILTNFSRCDNGSAVVHVFKTSFLLEIHMEVFAGEIV